MGPEAGAAAHFGTYRRSYQALRFRSLLSFFVVLVLTSLLCAQAPTGAAVQPGTQTNAAGPYQLAVQAANNGDLNKFEQLASTPQTGSLRQDAMMWLVWEYKRQGDNNRAQRWASDLLSVQPGNALALAVLANADQQLTRTSPSEPGAEQSLSHAKQALRELDRLHKPEGMTDAAFSEMTSELARTLNGAIGYAYYQRSDFVTARTYLRKAAALAPANAQYAYALSIADLDGRNPDKAEGFQMLARAVDLTQGTAPGRELEAYARKRYKDAGGTDAVWDEYLANTRVPTTAILANAQPAAAPTRPAPTTPAPTPAPVTSATASSATPATSGGTTASISAPASNASATGASQPAAGASAPTTAPNASIAPSTSAATTTAPTTATATPSTTTTATATNPPAAAATPPTSAPANTATSQPVAAAPATAGTTSASPANTATVAKATPPNPTIADVRAPDLPPARPAPPHVPPPLTAPPNPMIARRGTPISLGILVQSTAASRETRATVVNNLSDMVRHLRNDDEAFLLSFSNDVAIEQDLTNNPQSLEDAMDKIQPTPGTALFDAVAFAAGHLKRIAKNGNRVLLVISDGANNTDRISPMELSGDISLSGVQIFCIGMQAATVQDQQRLRALADRTGGSAVFLNDAAQFRGATHEIAQRMGIPFE